MNRLLRSFAPLLIGISLFSAVFADLFLSPVMLRYFKPRISAGGASPIEAGVQGDESVRGNTHG